MANQPGLMAYFKTEGEKRAFQVACAKRGKSASHVLRELSVQFGVEVLGTEMYQLQVAEVDDAPEGT